MTKNNTIQFDYVNREMTIYYGEFEITVKRLSDCYSATWRTQETGKVKKDETRSNLESICSWLNSLGGWDSASEKLMLRMGTDFLFFM